MSRFRVGFEDDLHRQIAGVGASAFAVYFAVRQLERRRARDKDERRMIRQHRGCVVGIVDLMDSTGLSERSVVRALSVLRRVGWIITKRVGRTRLFVGFGNQRGGYWTHEPPITEEDLKVGRRRNHTDLGGHATPPVASHEAPPPPKHSPSKAHKATTATPPVASHGVVSGRQQKDKSEFPVNDLYSSLKANDRNVDPLIVNGLIVHRLSWTDLGNEDPIHTAEPDPNPTPPLPPRGAELPSWDRRSLTLLESARRKFREDQAGQYTGDEAVIAWRYRYVRRLGFEDPDLRTAAQQKRAAKEFTRRATDWAGGDREQLLRFLRESFNWWVERNAANESFPGGAPSWSKLLRQRPGGETSWFWTNWLAGGTARRSTNDVVG